jgi:hypothetical protein
VLKEIMEVEVPLVLKVLPDLQEHKVLREIMEVEVLLVLKVQQVPLVPKVLLVPRVDYQLMLFLKEELLFGLVKQTKFHQVGLYVMEIMELLT